MDENRMTNQIRMTNDDARFAEDARDLAALLEISPEEWAEGFLALAPKVFPEENWDDLPDSA
jgi:hypothetical protein